MFGALPDLFKDEDELRQLWSDPDTRKALLERLAERGYDLAVLKQIRKAILADNSDLFDVLARIAFSTDLKTRAERAEQSASVINAQYDTKLAVFLNFVLGHYVESGAENLDRAKLPDYLKVKYGSTADAARQLGGSKAIGEAFVGFQKHLYS